ncbi:predicted protein [Chaetomium globosum CBS 148.51]|uniref:Uncharacterized protein n=1 Tax=Chaetomium globosum (strain ATCC 6205 / CBS 148.51 / DSM 1962 / NBRC 6347 / NRRL 1970) TaxID=306901 RepID=Q2GLY2_CHAGB|nr:uncharacterized protein CHGG_11074 [Chaetomium globosum CBS 148.51]EAQ82898.1 predicted protein [Chaetomium globosum CBS 148.51]
MCVTIQYTCPRCEGLTGEFTRVSCKHIKCCKNEPVRQPMVKLNLGHWFCGTEGCEYSLKGQQKQDDMVRHILTSQYKNLENDIVRQSIEDHKPKLEWDNSDAMDLGPEPPRQLFGPRPALPPAPAPAAVPAPVPAPGPTPARAPVPAHAPAPVPAPAANLAAAANPAVGPAAPFYFHRPQRQPVQNQVQGPPAVPDLSAFPPADAANIRRLLQIITPRRHGTEGQHWLPEEEELLELLCDVWRMPTSRVSRDFLPHRSKNGCDSHRSQLRRQRRL